MLQHLSITPEVMVVPQKRRPRERHRIWDHPHTNNLWGQVPLTFLAPRMTLEHRGGRSQWIPQRSHCCSMPEVPDPWQHL